MSLLVDSLEDLLNVVVVGLQQFSVWADDRLPLAPWPVWLGLWFPLVVAVLRCSRWFIQGRTLPVRCGYFHTQQRHGLACATLVVGEWRYCRYHDHAYRAGDGHHVDPTLQKWELIDTAGNVVEQPLHRGVGFISLRPRQDTLLFHRGYARRPGDVAHAAAATFRTRLARMSALKKVFTQSRAAIDLLPESSRRRLARAVAATRSTLLAVAFGLSLAGIGILMVGTTRAAINYLSAGCFLAGWACFRYGILVDETDWVVKAARQALRWTVVALCTGAVLGALGAPAR